MSTATYVPSVDCDLTDLYLDSAALTELLDWDPADLDLAWDPEEIAELIGPLDLAQPAQPTTRARRGRR